MADDLHDDVFVFENGIITNQIVPLILEQDLEANEDNEIGEPHPEFNDDQVIEEDAEGGNQQEALQNEPEGLDENGNVAQNGFQVALQGEPEGSQGNDNVSQNGFHISIQSVSSSSSATACSSVAFEQSEFLGASSPTPNQAVTCYVNEGYQSDLSELSEFNASVELQANILTVSYKEPSHRLASITEVRSRDFGTQVPDLSTSSHEDRQLSIVQYTPANGTGDLPVDRNKLQVTSSSSQNNSERIYPNPPNSPAVARGHLLPPQNRGANPQVRLAINPESPYNVFVKFGTFLLILVLLFLLAIVACLQDILPISQLTLFTVLLILSLIGTVGCYIKACFVAEEQTSETPRHSYGSTQTSYGSSENPRPSPYDA